MKKLFFIRFLIALSLIFFCILLSSCASIFPSPSPKRVFVLGSGLVSYCALSSDSKQDLILTEAESAQIFRNNKILFQTGSEIGFYQLSEWSEPVVDRIQQLLSEKLRCMGYNVSELSSTARSTDPLKVSLTVLDFSHKAETQPGQLELKIRVETFSVSKKAEKVFQYSQILTSYDADGVVLAADQILSQFLRDSADFINSFSTELLK